jgi:uncharacterized protein
MANSEEPIKELQGFVPGAWSIEAYGAGGFRFADMSHRGSILALPSGVRAWSATTASEIDAAALQPLFAEPAGAIELLIVGTGVTLVPLSAALRDRLREAGVRLDFMATGSAVSTYNILLGERRRVAGAFLATL